MDQDENDSVVNKRRRPNILVTGTPGVGKTSTASLIAERLGMRHISVGDLVSQHKLHEGRDEDLDTNILDEDKLLDILEPMFDNDNIVLDFHVCEIFPERWFDLVLVLRARTDILFDRLTARKYSEKKRSENLECEIMQVVLDEAREAYDVNIVHAVDSNTIKDMDDNVQRVKDWIRQWKIDNNSDDSDGDDNDDEDE